MGVYTIGVVGDDAPIRELLTTFLEDEHYRVIAASTCDDALTLAREHRLDAFLMDIEINGDGIELCRSIRAMKVYRRTPIICITG